MKLNYECIRDLMLYLEEELDEEKRIDMLNVELFNYSKEDLIYSAKKLIEAQYLNGKANYASNKIYTFQIVSITYSGHNFLDTIRPQTVWDVTKEKTKIIGSTSLEVMKDIAIGVAVGIIQTKIS